ncbi:hypothetical protein E2C01_043517 [Portunus trituberculatus]|uniref:Uncharacterized protein n=1 Tax=Portunus trituberculatus TaxID=210409 RepID=A0A5B7FWK8_PORTR|nr:hypothetical protein [Portunus trituberculatus]
MRLERTVCCREEDFDEGVMCWLVAAAVMVVADGEGCGDELASIAGVVCCGRKLCKSKVVVVVFSSFCYWWLAG